MEFQHKNREDVIKKHSFSFVFPTHLMQGKTNHCCSHASPSVSAHAKSPLGAGAQLSEKGGGLGQHGAVQIIKSCIALAHKFPESGARLDNEVI